MPASNGCLRSDWTVKRVFAAVSRARHHSKKAHSISSSFCSPSAEVFPDGVCEKANGTCISPYSDVFDISSNPFPEGDTHRWWTNSTSPSTTPSTNTPRTSLSTSESLILPSELATPQPKRLRPLPAIPESHGLRRRPIRVLPTPPSPSNPHPSARPAVLHVKTSFHSMNADDCDSPTILATALPPPPHAVARVGGTPGAEGGAAHDMIDWALLERVLCEDGVER